MNKTYRVTWQGMEVGEVSQLQNDMWYYQGQFLSKNPEVYEELCRFLKQCTPEYIFEHPSEEFMVYLGSGAEEPSPIRFLVFSIKEDVIFMRIMTS